MTYPLQAARELRTRAVEEAEAALAQAVAAHARAAQALERAEAARSLHAEGTAAFADSEKRCEARSIADLQRGDSFLRRRMAEAADLTEQVAAASAAVDAAAGAVGQARAHLGSMKAEQEAVERHHAKWLEARRKTLEKREEEEGEEVAAARRFPRES